MTDALGAIEAAIAEVTKARNSVRKKKSRQVSAVEEIDHLKSVAFAWFKAHRPITAAHPSHPNLLDVDSHYQAIIESTGRHAHRTTYLNCLLALRQALLDVRSFVATHLHVAPANPPATTTDIAPNFAPLAADSVMQAILQRRWDEIQRCIRNQANLAATVMMGGLLESLLLARIGSSGDQRRVFTAKAAPRNKRGKTLGLSAWKLVNMVEVAHELNWITRSAKDVGNVLRDFRNYIHPHKEYTDAVLIVDEDAHMFWEVTKSITRHVLGSVGKIP